MFLFDLNPQLFLGLTLKLTPGSHLYLVWLLLQLHPFLKLLPLYSLPQFLPETILL